MIVFKHQAMFYYVKIKRLFFIKWCDKLLKLILHDSRKRKKQLLFLVASTLVNGTYCLHNNATQLYLWPHLHYYIDTSKTAILRKKITSSNAIKCEIARASDIHHSSAFVISSYRDIQYNPSHKMHLYVGRT